MKKSAIYLGLFLLVASVACQKETTETLSINEDQQTQKVIGSSLTNTEGQQGEEDKQETVVIYETSHPTH